jgi:hypothetical protein
MKTAPKSGGGISEFQSPGRPGNHLDRTKSTAIITTPLPGTPRMSQCIDRRWAQ